MARLDWRNNSIKLLSVLLAFILWVYVSSEQNPVREKIVSVNLGHTGLGQNYLIAGGLPEAVKVRVQGNRNQLNNLVAGDFKAVVHIPEGKTGEISLPVQVTSPAGLRVTQVTPEEVRVSVDRIEERLVSVAVSLKGSPAQGYTALAPVYSPSTVLVRGPGRVISEINQVTAVVDITSAVKDVEQGVPVSAGNQNVSLSPAVVRVVVPVVSTAATKVVPVLPNITGSPAAGFAVRRSYTEPATVQISGPPEMLEDITGVRTVPVDIQGINQNLAKDAGLVTPQGITAVSPQRVRVLVEVGSDDSPQPPNDGAR